VIPLPFVFFGNLEFSLPIALGKAPMPAVRRSLTMP
jgi:hypothetical protein